MVDWGFIITVAIAAAVAVAFVADRLETKKKSQDSSTESKS